MTPQRASEIANEITGRIESPGDAARATADIAEAILDAVAAERERCAKIAEDDDDKLNIDFDASPLFVEVERQIAAKIRSGDSPPY